MRPSRGGQALSDLPRAGRSGSSAPPPLTFSLVTEPLLTRGVGGTRLTTVGASPLGPHPLPPPGTAEIARRRSDPRTDAPLRSRPLRRLTIAAVRAARAAGLLAWGWWRIAEGGGDGDGAGGA